MSNFRTERGASLGALVAWLLVGALVAWQIYRGATVQKVGIPGVFEIEFGDAKPKFCMTEDVGYDRYGTKGSVDVDRQAASAQECESVCLQDAQCQAVSYHISSKQCWIKDSIPLRVPNADYVSAVKSVCP